MSSRRLVPVLTCVALAACGPRFRPPPIEGVGIEHRLLSAERDAAWLAEEIGVDGPQLRLTYEMAESRYSGRVALRQDLADLGRTDATAAIGAAAMNVVEAREVQRLRRIALRRLALECEVVDLTARRALVERRFTLRSEWLATVRRGLEARTHTMDQESKAGIRALALELRRDELAGRTAEVATALASLPESPRLPVAPDDLVDKDDAALLDLVRRNNAALHLARGQATVSRHRAHQASRSWWPRLDFLQVSVGGDVRGREVIRQPLIDEEDVTQYLVDDVISGGSPDPLVGPNELARASTTDVREKEVEFAVDVQLGMTFAPVEARNPGLAATSHRDAMLILALDRRLLERLLPLAEQFRRCEQALAGWREHTALRLSALRAALAALPARPNVPPDDADRLIDLEEGELDLRRRYDQAMLAVLELICVDVGE